MPRRRTFAEEMKSETVVQLIEDTPLPRIRSSRKKDEGKKLESSSDEDGVVKDESEGSGSDSSFNRSNKRNERRRRRNSSSSNSSSENSRSSELPLKQELEKTTAAELLGSFSNWDSVEEIHRDGEILKFVRAKQKVNVDKELWNVVIYAPDSKKVSNEEKQLDESRIRDPIGDGIFIDETVKVAKRNLNKLERRIVREGGTDWFDNAGFLKIEPNPLRSQPIELLLPEDVPTEFNTSTFFVPATLDPFQQFQFDSTLNYQLVLEIGEIQFRHFPLFSKEHVLVSKLESLYEKYLEREEENIGERSEKKLKALREALNYTKASLAELEKEEKEDAEEREKEKEMIKQVKDRIKMYRNHITKTKVERDDALWEDKILFCEILEAWKQIKKLRETQDFAITGVKLTIVKMALEPNDMIENEILDLKEEYEEKYKSEMSRYKGKLNNWLAKRGSSEDEESSRPKPPKKFDYEKTREFVIKRHKEMKSGSGDQKLRFELEKNGVSIENVNEIEATRLSVKEENRKKSLSETQFQIRIIFNGKEFYRSMTRQLGHHDTSVYFGLTIPIDVREWPEVCRLEIYDIKTILNRKIASAIIPLPNKRTTIERATLEKIQFESKDAIKKSNGGVGAGIELDILGHKYKNLFTSGHVTTRIGWSADSDGNALCPRGYGEDKEIANLRRNSMDEIDPNNPQNVDWSITQDSTVKERSVEREKTPTRGKLTLNNLESEFDFCSMEEVESSLRLQVLQMRDEEVNELRFLKMVSSSDHLIPIQLSKEYERKVGEEMKKRLGERKESPKRRYSIEDATIHESNRLEKIRELRLNVLRLFESHLKRITFEDLVLEEQFPDIGTLGLNIMSLFQPNRPLRPTRKERKRLQTFSIIDTKMKVHVNIVRAFNLPMRRDADVGLMTTEAVAGLNNNKKGPMNYSTPKPFVEIWFQRNVCRTTTGVGSNPTWNQELQLPLILGEESGKRIENLDDLVYLLLYDEVAMDLLEDERRRETDIHQRLEKRWLGSINIPFSTLYSNGRIEGTFKLKSPSVLLGYEAQGMSSHFRLNPANIPQMNSGVPVSNGKNAFITLFMTIQPSINPAVPSKEELGTGESSQMLAHVLAWKSSIVKKHPSRNIRPFVMTIDGDTVLCTRFLSPIPPPESIMHKGNLLEKMEDLAHYVSLFPGIRDCTLGITDYPLWFTSDVFVMTPGGGMEDHAVLLASFFLHLKVPTWIALGNAIPDGPTAFVLTSFKGVEDETLASVWKKAVLIWNPSTGEFFSVNDSFCPLQKLWALIGKSNIWGNVSELERPHQLDWELGKSKFWLPLFSKPVGEHKLPSVQPENIKYKTADQVQANTLAQRLERHLKDVFMRWRPTSKTNWNRYCSGILRRLLPRLEKNRIKRSEIEVPDSPQSLQSSPLSINDEHLGELKEVISSYQMTGFPLQQPYVSTESIVEAVHSSGVHTIDSLDVEFAIAVYAQAYPASVYSLWVYVAALHLRK